MLSLAATLALALFQTRMPNLTQSEIPGLPLQGRMYCCPTAVANGLLWLTQTGSFNVSPPPGVTGDAGGLVRQLAKAFGTDPKLGTQPDRAVSELWRYLVTRGYPETQIRLSGGFASVSQDRSELPTPTALSGGLGPDRFTLLILNVYGPMDSFGRRSVVYQHWVTLSGYDAVQAKLALSDPMDDTPPPKPALQLAVRTITPSDALIGGDPAYGLPFHPLRGRWLLSSYPGLLPGEVCIVEGLVSVKPGVQSFHARLGARSDRQMVEMERNTGRRPSVP